jgi:hypothetical protein
MSRTSLAWFYDWTGREVTCREDTENGLNKERVIRVEEQVSEFEDQALGQRVTLALGRYQDDGLPVILKLKYESVVFCIIIKSFKLIFYPRLNPKHFNFKDKDGTRKLAEALFYKEVECVDDVHDSGHTPEMLGYDDRDQEPSMPYPNGYLFILVMSRVPGENVERIHHQLTPGQLESIRVQLSHTLE